MAQEPETPPAAQAEASETQAPVVEVNGPTIAPIGSKIRLRTTAMISSKSARKGDLVRLEVSEDWAVDGKVIIPAGTLAFGELTQATKKGMMGRGGKLEARMLYLEMPSGPVRISGSLDDAGRDQTDLATVAAVATLGFTSFITGKTAEIPEGTELSVELDREASIPHQQSAEASSQSGPA